jgi:Domain of Unknown Function (DUF349)
MPQVHFNKTGGARRGMTYVGVSERSFGDDSERRQKRARRQKKALVKEAKLLAVSEDWKLAGEQLASLHHRWKAAGFAGKPYEQKLWKSFKAATDLFHRRRISYFQNRNRDAKQLLSTKEQLIAEARRLSAAPDFSRGNTQFKDLMVRWREAGHAGTLEDGLWEQFNAARQALYDATAQDRTSLQSEYVQRLTTRIRQHREALGKLRSARRELTIRRHAVIPGWVGEEMIEDFDKRIAGIEASVSARQQSLDQDVEKLNRAQLQTKAQTTS